MDNKSRSHTTMYKYEKARFTICGRAKTDAKECYAICLLGLERARALSCCRPAKQLIRVSIVTKEARRSSTKMTLI